MNEQQTKERLAEFMKGEWPLGTRKLLADKMLKGDWNLWRQVEEKVMEDDSLIAALYHEKMNESYSTGFMCIADLPTRCKALVAVLSNSPSSDDSN